MKILNKLKRYTTLLHLNSTFIFIARYYDTIIQLILAILVAVAIVYR